MTDEIREYLIEHGYEPPADDDVDALLEMLYEIIEKLPKS